MSVEQENTPQPVGEDDLPDWLKEIRGQSATSSPSAASSDAEADTEDEDLPAWLQEDQTDDVAEEVATDLDSASDEETTAEASTNESDDDDDDDDDDDLRRLLAEEGIEMDSLDEDRPEGAGDMSVRDWIAATSTESPLATSQAAAYDAGARAKDEAPETESTSSDEAGEAMPSWLQADAPTAEPEKPAWLADEATHDEVAAEAETASAAEDGDEDALPDWLREDAPADEAAETPAWLADETTMSEPDLAVTADVDDTIIDEEELPDWLQEGAELADDQAAPAWLADESTSEAVDEPVDEEATAADPVSEAEIDALVADIDTTAHDDGIVIEEELPDWLRGDSALEDIDPAAAEADTPSWLVDETTHDEAAPELTAADLSDDSADTEFSTDDDLPDWLSDEQAETEITGELSWLSDDSDETVDSAVPGDIAAGGGADEEELPDWLQNEALEQTDLEEHVPISASTAEADLDDDMIDIDGLPDWLRDDQAESEAEIETDSPETVEAVDTSDTTADASSEMVEDVPDWLKEEVEDHIAADEASLNDEPLARTEDIEESSDDTAVPSWLEKLRQSQGAADDTTTSEPAPESQPPVSTPERSPQSAELTQDVIDRLAVAQRTLEAGELTEALSVYQDLVAESQALEQVVATLADNVARYPSDPTLYEVMGDAHLKLGDYGQALSAYQHALDNL